MPQLQINQGPQDALLYDNTRSYFTNVGYVRTSNFQLELRDVDPQNTPTFGSTVQFVIPKAADLMGPVDLMIDLKKVDTWTDAVGDDGKAYLAWVESLGCAIIDKITFSVGSHDIETITGDQLYIANELMRADEQRFAKNTILKTGRPMMRVNTGTGTNTWTGVVDENLAYDNSGRLIASVTSSGSTETLVKYDAKKLIIPLGLFFTKHPSQYFPLAAIAGCNDVRISVKLRNLKEVIMGRGAEGVTAGKISGGGTALNSIPQIGIESCQLRTHYVHVTGPEASLLMNKEHVRLLKLWQPHSVQASITATNNTGDSLTDQKASMTGTAKTLFSFELPFLHPVQEIIIVIRKVSEMSDSTDLTVSATSSSTVDMKGACKNYFAFQGGNKDPNIESHAYTTKENGTTDCNEAYLRVNGFKLTLNGQERHPSLSQSGISRDYLMNRLMPMMHSNTSTGFVDVHDGHAASSVTSDAISTTVGEVDAITTLADYNDDNLKALGEMYDRKEIYVYPFAINPEGQNPSGAVNFSKVSHAKLEITGTAFNSLGTAVNYQCDVWGVHYNWLQIKDGRAITSFA